MVDWCAARGIVMKGHPLLWDSEHGRPAWTPGQPDAATQRQHVEDLLRRYQDRITYWEVVNEPENHPGVALMPAHGWARAAAPGARLVVNEYGPFYNGHPRFLDRLTVAQKDDVPFDAVGIQAHAPPDMAFPLARVKRVLDAYAQLGVPLHITEFIPPSSGGAMSGAVWRGQWTEESQAVYAEEMYRVLFAHPAVTAITWWDFSDHGAWIAHGGLLRADASPKPAYDRLRRLIKETWHSETEAITDAGGRFDVQGYHGTYTVTVLHGDQQVIREITLRPGGEPTLRISI
jgi:GH35 family endo-1,4-beta-xylanase